MEIRTRKGKRVTLPDDDGLIPVVKWQQTPFGLQPHIHLLDAIQHRSYQYRVTEKMQAHDTSSVTVRWGGNQWGDAFTGNKPKPPLLKTDLTLEQYKKAIRCYAS